MSTAAIPESSRAPAIPQSLRFVLTTLICAAVFLICLNLNIEAPLHDRGYGTNDLNAAKSSCDIQNIISAWGEDPEEDHCATAAGGTAAHAAAAANANLPTLALSETEVARLERDDLTPRARLSYEVDFIFIAIYLAGFLVAIAAFKSDTPKWLARWKLLYVLAIMGAICDAIENVGAFHKLDSGASWKLVWVATPIKLGCFVAVLIMLVMIALLRGATWKCNAPIVVRAIYHLRIPLLVQAALIGFAYVDATSQGFAKMSRGIFDVERWKATMLVSMLCFLLAWSAMILTRIILAYGGDRFYGSGRDPAPVGVNVPSLNVAGRMYWSTLALYSLPAWFPIARVIGVAEDSSNRWMKLWFVAAGAVIALFLLIIIDLLRLHERAVEPQTNAPVHDFALPFQQSATLTKIRNRLLGQTPLFGDKRWFVGMFKHLGPGFTDPETGDVKSGHLLAFSAVAVLSVLYVASYWLHGGTWAQHIFPPVVLWFVVLVVGELLWIGSFMTFWLDLYRIPVLLAALVLVEVLGLVHKDDHYIATTTRSGSSHDVSPEQVVTAWLQKHQGDGNPVVIVTSAGGGIQAAAWTEKVLTSMEAATASCDSDFRSSVLLMSSVSGGSVGVMYYADSYREHPNVKELPDDEREHLQFLAGRTSLADVGWGIAYPDSMILRPFVATFDDELDRGSAMQEAWGSGWNGSGSNLSDWRNSVAKGEQPAVLLNSTVVETGQRFEITNADPFLPGPVGATSGDAALSFGSEFPDCDLPLLTATRLSATFPWVSPVPRTEPSGCGKEYPYHFADGGYYDNFGVDSAVDWLVKSRLFEHGLGKHRLIWLEIIAFPDDPPPLAKSWGWTDQELAPVTGMMDVRSTSQKENARQLRDGYIGQFQNTQNAAYQFIFQGKNAPLSWHLLQSQKQDIADTWDWYEGLNDSAFYKVKTQFCKEPNAAPATPDSTGAASAPRPSGTR